MYAYIYIFTKNWTLKVKIDDHENGGIKE